ncbi:hypothetical protein GGR92_005223 [Spirosoma lacussanchae]|uniref:hypothetical protein n=1 Tax=Spirosoma lacussanchae TaxID=1884249 RepID=UPI0011080697|nr:hypothetical protein [Spirosoma lacussanchae]
MTNAFCGDCVDDYCVDAVLPALEPACEVSNDEAITEIFLTDQGHPIVGDPTLAASWTARLSNTSDGSGTGDGNVAHPIRSIEIVDGQKPVPTLNYKKNLRGTQARLGKSTRTITFVDDDDSDAKYKMWLAYQCNPNALLYYRSGKHFYGKDASKTGAGSAVGIRCAVKPTYGIVPGGTDMAHRWTVTIEWDATCEEDRFDAPL